MVKRSHVLPISAFTLSFLAGVAPATRATALQDPEVGFQGGDLYLLGNAVPLDGHDSATGLPAGPAILHTDIGSGNQRIVRAMAPDSFGHPTTMAYDHYRDRLVFWGRPTNGVSDLWAMDVEGNLTSLGFQDDPFGLHMVATADDGRIYFLRFGLQYLDAANVMHSVSNSSGTGGVFPPSPEAMHFDSDSRALFLLYGTARDFFHCGGVDPEGNQLTIRRLSLSADGTRVVADECNISRFVSGPENVGSGLSPGPNGKLLAFARSFLGLGSESPLPRMFLVDPVTLECEIYASNGPYTGAAWVNAGCYSSVLDRAVIVDAAARLANGANNAKLRTFFQGQTGGTGQGLGERLVNSGTGTISWLTEIDKPRDFDPPHVRVTEPADEAIVGTTSVPLRVEIEDASPTHVTSDPAGIAGDLPAGGGELTGVVALPFEGENVLTVLAEDSAGNGAGDSVVVTRDTLLPRLLITVPAEGTLFAASPIVLQAIVEDATATTLSFGEALLDLPAGGGPASFEASLVEGTNTVRVIAVDAAGNLSEDQVTVVLDETAPLVTIDRPTSGASFGAGESIVLVEATVDDLSATMVESSPPGVSAELSAGGGVALGLVELAEGDNALQVSATDATGRTGSAVVAVRLDTTAPIVVIESPLPAMALRGVVEFFATVVDPLPGTGVPGVELLVDGALVEQRVVEPYATLVDTSVLADGVREFEAIAVDGKGNTGRATNPVLVDNTAPGVTIDAPQSGALVRGGVEFQAAVADGESGLGSVAMTVGGLAPTEDASILYSAPLSSDLRSAAEATTRFPDGPLEFSVLVRDVAGNETRAASQVIVDNTAPARSLVSPLDDSVVLGTIKLIGATDSADASLLELLVDGESQGSSPISPLVISFDTTARPDGLMTVSLVVTDFAGNESLVSATVTIDNLTVRIQPATVNLKAKAQGASVTAEVRGIGVAALLPSDSTAYELRVPGGSPMRASALRSFAEGSGIKVEFDRAALAAAVRAGIAAGAIQSDAGFTVQLFVSGRALGSDTMKAVGH